MNRNDAQQFAERWIAAWNRKDVNAVLAHYADDATFISPKAAIFTGHAVVKGKDALAQYWRTGASKLAIIEFTLDRIVWDGDARELVVFYEANLNGTRSRACEAMTFDHAGRQIFGEALYGAAV
jgi:ketosteroid isomerase-like protein